ncbi:hypothetical protein P9J83_15985 [Clostridium sporogenes]|uniref:Uncharacterized protein n=1 Tax=Clostridium sporogenes TaxID=1509 RepID=A0AAE4FPR4_CLOSG|nr:hypothetical protein [Clostridium sporogenes]MDS1004985.1 hypothetical protein [Clostridium sporogenes]
MDELEKRNKAIAAQFDKKNVHIDKLKYLIDGVKCILCYFIANPSVEEKNCIHEILTYINNTYKE